MALVYECTAIGGQVDNFLLTDLPDGLVNGFDISRNVWNVLDGAAVGNDHVFHVIIPKTKRHELFHQPRVGNLEFSCQDATRIDVARVRFKALVEAEDLARASSRHGSDEQ